MASKKPIHRLVAESEKLERRNSEIAQQIADQATQTVVLFVDLSGSSEMKLNKRPLEWLRPTVAFLHGVHDACIACGGRTIKAIGDELMIEFPSTEKSERFFDELASRKDLLDFKYKIGIDHGLVYPLDPLSFLQGDIYGDTVDRCARIAKKADLPGTILCSGQYFDKIRRTDRDKYLFVAGFDLKDFPGTRIYVRRSSQNIHTATARRLREAKLIDKRPDNTVICGVDIESSQYTYDKLISEDCTEATWVGGNLYSVLRGKKGESFKEFIAAKLKADPKFRITIVLSNDTVMEAVAGTAGLDDLTISGKRIAEINSLLETRRLNAPDRSGKPRFCVLTHPDAISMAALWCKYGERGDHDVLVFNPRWNLDIYARQRIYCVAASDRGDVRNKITQHMELMADKGDDFAKTWLRLRQRNTRARGARPVKD